VRNLNGGGGLKSVQRLNGVANFLGGVAPSTLGYGTVYSGGAGEKALVFPIAKVNPEKSFARVVGLSQNEDVQRIENLLRPHTIIDSTGENLHVIMPYSSGIWDYGFEVYEYSSIKSIQSGHLKIDASFNIVTNINVPVSPVKMEKSQLTVMQAGASSSDNYNAQGYLESVNNIRLKPLKAPSVGSWTNFVYWELIEYA